MSEKVAEFQEEYAELANLPLTRRDGRRLRRSLVEEWREEKVVESDADREEAATVGVTEFGGPLTWGAAVEELLRDHARMRNTTLEFVHGDGTEWSKPADNRWMAEYQKRYFAQMKAWFRELLGGERPSGGTTAPTFDPDRATVVLLTRSASSVPDGERLAPTDHDAQIAESWEDCYHTLRNTMRSLGFELGEDWQYDRRQEPHAGKRGSHGTNRCYGHEHTIVIVDGEVTPGELRPVVEKHVEATPAAGREAHDLDVPDWDADPDAVNTVECKSPDELEDPAAYVAGYCAIEPTDLLERSVEYVAWAAVKHATNSRSLSRSSAANAASTADACRQRAEDPKTEQVRDHGEEVRRAPPGAHHDIECAACGSPHDIEQETLTAARLGGESGGGGTAVADGGGSEETLRDRWRDADGAASVSVPLVDADLAAAVRRERELKPGASVAELAGRFGAAPETVRAALGEGDGPDRETDAFDDPPEPGWRLDAVTVGEETHAVACDGGGPEMVTVSLPVDRLLRQTSLGDVGAERTKWRASGVDGGDGVAVWGGERMAWYLVDSIGMEDPDRAEAVIEAVRGPLAGEVS